MRAHQRRSHCEQGHEFTVENTRRVPRCGFPTHWLRICLTCDRAKRAVWAEQRALRLPFGPVDELLDARGIARKRFERGTGIAPYRSRWHGLSVDQADRAADFLGVHPLELWPAAVYYEAAA